MNREPQKLSEILDEVLPVPIGGTTARSRNRTSAKAAGARFERVIADHLASELDDDRIDRRMKNGAKDRGDIGGVRSALGDRVVIECKDFGGRVLVGEWLREARIEAGNDDARMACVIAKRRGISDPGEQLVLMTVADLCLLLGSGGDDE